MKFYGRRPNPVFSDEYKVIRQVVIEAREKAGLSQRQLSALIGKPQSHVCCIERGQRRIDSLEFYAIAKSLGTDPAVLFGIITERLNRLRGSPAEVAELRLGEQIRDRRPARTALAEEREAARLSDSRSPANPHGG